MSEHATHPTTPTSADAQTSSAEQFTKSLTPEAVEITKTFGWDFFKAGVLIVDEQPDPPGDPSLDPEVIYLLVKEAKTKELQPDGTKKWVKSNKGKWNLPCGRLQPGESFEQAARREGREESGFQLELGRLVHIGHRADSDNPYVILIYAAAATKFIASPDPEEIVTVDWFTYDEIIKLKRENNLRNPDLTLSAVDYYRKYTTQPAGLLVAYPSKS